MRTTTDKILALGIIFVIIVFFGYLLKTGIDKTKNTKGSTNKPQITTSFYPLYFFASQIALDKADVHNITPAGSEPHDYEPTTQDIARIEDSSLIILNGNKFEAWGDKIKENLKSKNVLILSVGETLADQEINTDGEKTKDPHIWLDPILAKKEVDLIYRAISKIDPANSIFYQTKIFI